ncbi:cytochrome P450 oxidoreductase-like protein [Ophiobolus disseminans]|uniref:Cytochrome P450 oxidoreductase-like protein n=1 Tax=Ophiobolus disseminans TaxID=1469910 RepID=A0A6A7A559_9PLEO|nr:cytochrome P450 oxidoreductase-like protein [Ophiobolus disseminans]
MVLMACWILLKVLRSGRREKYLPPGPPTVPILGNAHLMPWTNLHLKLKEWSDRYGPVYSLKIGSTTMVVLNEPRAVHQLMTKKGALYVDRPVDEQWKLATDGESFFLAHAGPIWRTMRKIAGQALSSKVLDGKLAEIQEAEMNQWMLDLLNEPEDYRSHTMRTSTSVTSIMLYGHRAPRWDGFWASLLEAIKPGSYLPVAQFPILDWLPGQFKTSKEVAKSAYCHNVSMFSRARAIVDSRRELGDIRESLLDRLIDGLIKPDIPLSFSQITHGFLGAMHQGASETSAMATLTSVLFLALNPQVQEKARQELDRVCGVERIPRWSDMENLPYISCIVKEGLRIRPVVPNGIPYRAREDSWYEGMLVPKDATVVVPIYALHHTYYANAAVYNPDRYCNNLKSSYENASRPDYENRDHYTFGSGRRLCPGIHLGERTVWRMTAKILWAFEIKRAVDEHGKDVELSPDAYEIGMSAAPMPFKVRIVPRTAKHAAVIRSAAADIKKFLKQWE